MSSFPNCSTEPRQQKRQAPPAAAANQHKLQRVSSSSSSSSVSSFKSRSSSACQRLHGSTLHLSAGDAAAVGVGYPCFLQRKMRSRPLELTHWDRPHEEMDVTKILRANRRCILPPYVDDPVVEKDSRTFSKCSNRQGHSKSPPLQPYTSGAQHSESSAAYILWPPRTDGSAPDRAAYFNGLQKVAELYAEDRKPSGQQAATLLDLMTIRAFHSKALRRYSLGTALGFRTRKGVMTEIPAIIVFVVRKLHKQWLLDGQNLPAALEGPGGVWCDVDVVEFSYYGAPTVTPKEQIYTELVEGLRGNDTCIGSGSQVASQETYGTLGAIVRSQTGARQVGFITNRHVAVDLDYPNQKMFHPLPPNLGPGVYLGAVERATSFITDDLWYGVFAGMNPETFVRADGAFIPFTECFDTSTITTNVKEVGEVGDVFRVDLQAPLGSVVGKHVKKVGRSSGLTEGTIMAYAVEYNDEKGICFFTDFLIVGENRQTFDLEGDSGSLILLPGEDGAKPRPIGIIWGGTANRGRLKLINGCGPESWTSGVDLGRLLDLLQVDLITSSAALKEALEENLADGTATDSIMGDLSSRADMRDSLLLIDVEGPTEITSTVDNENFLHFEVMRKSFQGDDINQGLLFQEGSIQKAASNRSDNIKYTGSCEIGLSLSNENRVPRSGDEAHLKATRTSVEDVSLGLYLGERESKRSRSSS